MMRQWHRAGRLPLRGDWRGKFEQPIGRGWLDHLAFPDPPRRDESTFHLPDGSLGMRLPPGLVFNVDNNNLHIDQQSAVGMGFEDAPRVIANVQVRVDVLRRLVGNEPNPTPSSASGHQTNKVTRPSVRSPVEPSNAEIGASMGLRRPRVPSDPYDCETEKARQAREVAEKAQAARLRRQEKVGQHTGRYPDGISAADVTVTGLLTAAESHATSVRTVQPAVLLGPTATAGNGDSLRSGRRKKTKVERVAAVLAGWQAGGDTDIDMPRDVLHRKVTEHLAPETVSMSTLERALKNLNSVPSSA